MSLDLLNILQQTDFDRELTDEEEERFEESGRLHARTEKRNKRIADCGKWSNWYNPHNGKRTGYLFRCELFRYCENCLTHRADQHYELMVTASLEKRMVAKVVTPKEATRLIRKAEKTEYIRFPQEDGTDLLLLNESVGVEGKEVDMHWVVAQDWSKIMQTPEGRNKSGTMHLPISEDDPEDFTIIAIKQFVTDADRGLTIQAMDEAEEETADLNPQSPDDVIVALHKRTSLATRKLRQQGYQVNLYDKRLKLIHSLVDWTGQNPRHIKRSYTENPTYTDSISTCTDVRFPVSRAVVAPNASVLAPINQ